MPSTMSILRSSATTTTLTDTEDTTNRPILVRSVAANAARCQAAEAEPGSDLEYAISDFFHAVRATAQFAVSIFVGPRSRALTATK
jgi:hypothetical protein